MKARPTVTLVLAGALLVLGLDYATFAATGDSLVLGRVGSADRTTTIANTGAGPALALRTKPNAPPLTVSSSRKVARLNADAVDGRSASQLGVRTTLYSSTVNLPNSAELVVTLADLAGGKYLVNVNGVLRHGPGNDVDCFFGTEQDTTIARRYVEGNAEGIYDVSTSTTLSIAAKQDVTYTCSTADADDFTSYQSEPLRIAFTRIDTLVVRNHTSAAPTRPAR